MTSAALPIVIKGRVRRGRGLGAVIGFPTANLELSSRRIPAAGVYVSRLTVEGEEWTYSGVTSVGPPSTVGVLEPTVETFLFDFEGDLYGRQVRLELVAYLRPMLTFGSLDQLKAAIRNDVERARILLCLPVSSSTRESF